MVLEIAACLSILVVLVFLATVDMAFSQLSDLSLRRLSADSDDTGKGAYSFLRQILEDRPRFRFALSSTIQLLLITFTVLVTMVTLRYTQNRTELLIYALLIGLLATVLFRQIIPRLIVRSNPERMLLFLLPIVRPLYSLTARITAPIASLFAPREQPKLEATVTPDSSDDRDDDEDIQALLEVGEAEGILEEDEREMIESMVEFAETRVGEIMTPRTEICSVPVETTIRSVRDLMIDQKYSRVPVYRGSVDNIEGIIYVRDLLQVWAEGGREDQPIASLLRDAFFVPETKSAAELLKTMQIDHVQLAIVVDEYGGVAGIVTVEDLIEEIVGEIEDEDTEEEEIIEIIEGEDGGVAGIVTVEDLIEEIVGEIEDEDTEEEEIIEIIEGEDGYFDVLGSTEVDKIERLFDDLDLEDDDYTTIAGMVTSEAGQVPKVGEILTIRGLDVEILRADEKRLALLRIRRHVEQLPDAEPAEE